MAISDIYKMKKEPFHGFALLLPFKPTQNSKFLDNTAPISKVTCPQNKYLAVERREHAFEIFSCSSSVRERTNSEVFILFSVNYSEISVTGVNK